MRDLAQTLAPAVPVGIGASFVTTIALNLWIAAKVVQVAAEDTSRQVILDAGKQAKTVTWVQPFPRLAEHRDLNQYLASIP